MDNDWDNNNIELYLQNETINSENPELMSHLNDNKTKRMTHSQS